MLQAVPCLFFKCDRSLSFQSYILNGFKSLIILDWKFVNKVVDEPVWKLARSMHFLENITMKIIIIFHFFYTTWFFKNSSFNNHRISHISLKLILRIIDLHNSTNLLDDSFESEMHIRDLLLSWNLQVEVLFLILS